MFSYATTLMVFLHTLIPNMKIYPSQLFWVNFFDVLFKQFYTPSALLVAVEEEESVRYQEYFLLH